MNEYQKGKYKNLLNKLYIIDSNLLDLIKYYEEIYLMAKENVSIETEELKTEILSSIKNSQIEIRKEIENDIIPLINTKI